MRNLLLLLPILLLTACSSLDFQIRALQTANMYHDVYYPSPSPVNSNFIFYQPSIYDNFWWNYSLNYPYNWYEYNSFGATYNWSYNRWSSNQWMYQLEQVPLAKETLNDVKRKLYRAIANVNILEGIRFYVSFACSFAFGELKLMEGSAKIISLIARDENQHLALTQNILNK